MALTDELEFDLGCRSVEPLAKERRKVARPRAGFSMESFACGTCGKTVTVKVASRKSVMSVRGRAAIRLATLMAFAVVVFRTVGLRGVSVGGALLVGLTLVAALASLRLLATLFASNFHLALDAALQRELERTHLGRHVHVYSKPDKDAWT